MKLAILLLLAGVCGTAVYRHHKKNMDYLNRYLRAMTTVNLVKFSSYARAVSEATLADGYIHCDNGLVCTFWRDWRTKNFPQAGDYVFLTDGLTGDKWTPIYETPAVIYDRSSCEVMIDNECFRGEEKK